MSSSNDRRGSLSELSLLPEYRSDASDLVGDFYLPCLERCSRYRRAVGFFTSRGLSSAAQGITALVRNGGRMQLVASPLFESDDLDAIEQGYLAREDATTRSLLRQLECTPDRLVEDRLGFLAWLISEQRLEIQIALAVDANDQLKRGIYHEKLGLFSDKSGHTIAFTGSPNETAGGLVENFETIDVFCSWRDPDGRVTLKSKHFERLWRNQTQHLRVLPFPEAAMEQLLRFRPSSPPTSEPRVWRSVLEDAPPPFPKTLWPHQVDAIEAWEAHDRQGLMSMATGSGKTRTALVAAERCPALSFLLIAVPSKALVDQWNAALSQHTQLPQAVLIKGNHSAWQDRLFRRLRSARVAADGQPVVAIGTLKSLAGDRFASVLKDAAQWNSALLVVDEAHNAGAPTRQRVLHENFPWRLGLSATPARHFDEVGTSRLEEYFVSTVYTYPLRRALEEGRLCRYRYHVYGAHLSAEEFQGYQQLTRQIIRARNGGSNIAECTSNALDGDGKSVERLLHRRALILKKCEAKLVALRVALRKHPTLRGLLYCSDQEQLELAAEVLGDERQLFLRYTSETSDSDRPKTLDALAQGHVPWVVAINCLDEGVDVPAVDQAILLASSSNKRQFVQRRGRILRRSDGKDIATLIDIVALPPIEEGPDAKWMLRGELARVKEMAELAMNRENALLSVQRLAEPFGVWMTELLSGEGDG